MKANRASSGGIERLGRLAALCLWLALCLLPACGEAPETIKIGYCGTLTGRGADAGVVGRDAVILAVEQINARGGVAGRRLELLTRNDGGDVHTAQLMDRDLLDAGVAAVIGHMTSDMTVPAVATFNQRRVPLISPTVSLNALVGKDDYLWRMRPDNAQLASLLAAHARDELGLQRLAAIVDLANAAYTRDWMESFYREFTKGDGQMVERIEIEGAPGGYAMAAAQKALAAKPDGLTMAANALDAAFICQQVRKLGFSGPIMLAGWALSPALVQQGGASVEGVITSELACLPEARPRLKRFEADFYKRFGYQPSLTGVHSHNAVQFLALGLEASLSRKLSLKQGLQSVGVIDGLLGPIAMDRYGDPTAALELQVVRDGRLAPLGPAPSAGRD